MKEYKKLFERIAKKIEVLYDKQFTGFDISFVRSRNGKYNPGYVTICPKLNGIGCWNVHGRSFDGDFENYAEGLDNFLSNRLEELNSRIEDVLEKNEAF